MKTFLDYASAKYYSGEPIISDEEFDKLAEYFNYERVGAPVALGDRVSHPFPMWSLQKCYDDEPLIDLGGDVVVTPKLDGAAVALYYVDGRLSLALTRGDGKEGLDITEKMATLVPNQLEIFPLPFMQITGEIVAPKTIDNARNYAAGALNLKSVEEFCSRNLTFVAYGVAPNINKSWCNDMMNLHMFGFNTVDTMPDFWLDQFPQDGQVYRLDNYEKFNALGYTAKHPRGAFALKERKGGVITRLLDVTWQVGRSGVVSPVAILEPVVVGEATVSRATLHNVKYIRELGLELGCLVEIIRAGEIIPRVVRRIDNAE
jgi:NAD-dependent DNA ligase